jgi:hypothetical protein
MDIKGVCYDVGRVYPSRFLTRKVFDPVATRRDLQVIRDDLHANAVRFQGRSISRLTTAAEAALELGLQVWLSPEMFERSQAATLSYLERAAQAAEPLRQRFGSQLTFCVGTEAPLFTKGIVPGHSVNQRIKNIRRAGLRNRPYAAQLDAFLHQAVQRVRRYFHGPLTYAATIFEYPDWGPFDVVGIDHYRNSKVEATYAERFQSRLQIGKPVVNAEFGHSSYRGDHPGHMEFGELDLPSLFLSRVHLARPHLKKGTNIRDEAHQADELIKTLELLDANGAAGAFIWTFADPWLTHSADPRYDLDMTSTALVKTHPDQTWTPKQSFHAVSAFYAS